MNRPTATADEPDRLPGGQPLRVTIVGGGIAGLATAHYLMKGADPGAVDVQVLERRVRPGGKLTTEHLDGFLLEGGPDAFLRMKPWALELCQELGLGDRVIPTRPESKDVFVLAGGKLRRMPPGLMLVVPTDLRAFLKADLLSWPGRVRALLDLVLPARKASDPTISELIGARFGSQAVDRLAQPLLAGIYAGDAAELSLGATFPQLLALAGDGRSMIRGAQAAMAARAAPAEPAPSAFLSLDSGMELLAETLVERLGRGVRRGGAVHHVERRKGPAGPYFRAMTRDGYERDADILVMATPAPIAASLLVELAPHVARSLAAIPHASTGTVSLGYRREDVKHPLAGYGFLVAGSEGGTIRGCTWTSSKFEGRAPHGHVLLRCFVGGRGREDDIALDDDVMLERVERELAAILGIQGSPVVTRIVRWPQGQPQYAVGHLDRVERLHEQIPDGLYLVGAAYGGVGIPDCVRSGRELAATLLASSARPGLTTIE